MGEYVFMKKRQNLIKNDSIELCMIVQSVSLDSRKGSWNKTENLIVIIVSVSRCFSAVQTRSSEN